MYAFLSWVFGLALDLYYRRHSPKGAVPHRGPVILVANHPNALLDPIVVTQIAGREVRFLGKEPLFRTPFLKYLVKGMGALPVYRAQDGHDTSKNAEMFSAVFEALARGEVVCLFPEGISHNLPRLQPLKTGAARMALGAESDNAFALDLKVVPVGIVYRDKRTFRSEVATFIGEPIAAKDFQSAYEEDERAATAALTDAINAAILSLTVNVDEWEDWPLLELAERAFVDEKADSDAERGPADDEVERTRRMTRISNAKDELRAIVPHRVDELRARIAETLDRAQQLGMDPEHVGLQYTRWGVFQFLVRNAFALVVGLPVAAIGLLAYGPPFFLLKFIPRWLTKDLDVVSTYRLLAGLLLFPTWHALLCVGLQALGARVDAPVDLLLWGGLILPFCGLYAHHFWRRRMAAWRDARVFLTLGFRNQIKRQVEADMAVISAEISALHQVVQRYREAKAAEANANPNAGDVEATASA